VVTEVESRYPWSPLTPCLGGKQPVNNDEKDGVVVVAVHMH
jgi:hypothetical protein